jgi:hypothetical protein
MTYSTTETGLGVLAVSTMLIIVTALCLLKDWLLETHPNDAD